MFGEPGSVALPARSWGPPRRVSQGTLHRKVLLCQGHGPQSGPHLLNIYKIYDIITNGDSCGDPAGRGIAFRSHLGVYRAKTGAGHVKGRRDATADSKD